MIFSVFWIPEFLDQMPGSVVGFELESAWECPFFSPSCPFSLTYSAPPPEQLSVHRTHADDAVNADGQHPVSRGQSQDDTCCQEPGVLKPRYFRHLFMMHHPLCFPWKCPLLGQYVLSERGMFPPFFSPSSLLSPSSGLEPFVSEDSPLLWTPESQSFLSSVLMHFIHFCCPVPLSPTPLAWASPALRWDRCWGNF